jgi:glyoxylase-like metal-dependent hydrolase (beta-lactamase superfamily II)
MVQDYNKGVYHVDSGYEGHGVASIYIVRGGGRTAVIDTAHNAALEPTLEAMAELGIAPDSVDYVLLTHVHLDHAGGAGRFMGAFPNARLVVHSRGARHMIDPSKLLAGVREVYGEAETARMYGELTPVPEGRIVIPRDGEELTFGTRTLVCLDTPGHARHHLAFFDRTSNSVFTGDAYGMSYFGLGSPGRQGVIPTTSPVQFEPDAMLASIDRIAAMKPDALYPTHFGEMRNADLLASDLRRQINAYVALTEEARGAYPAIRASLSKLLEDESATQGWTSPSADLSTALDRAMDLNAQGLEVWYKKKTEG